MVKFAVPLNHNYRGHAAVQASPIPPIGLVARQPEIRATAGSAPGVR
jgi:hypothetical protein